MARPLAPARPGAERRVASALSQLRDVRDTLAAEGCSQAADKVRAAIASTGGALRHVQRRADASAGRET